jgi:integrase/recombinase XerD
MSSLRPAVEDYLRIRRALGFKLERDGDLLSGFVGYLESVGTETVTIEHALRWATLPSDANPVWWHRRLSVVRGFVRYLQPIDPTAELPPTGALPRGGRRRPTPYVYSDGEILALIAAAGRWRSWRTPMASATLQTLIGLLAVTGLRIGEAIRLDRDDLDLEHQRLVVRNSKFGKSRELPLHPTTIEALRGYLHVREQLLPEFDTLALLITATGQRLERRHVEWQFARLRKRVGLIPRPGSHAPRLHDVRHTFAVRTMLDSYQSGGDPQARLAQPSTYLGHADPANTYWYLSAAPDLLALAAQRLEDHLTETSR